MLCYISIFKLVLILAGDIDLFQQSGWNSFDNVIDLFRSKYMRPNKLMDQTKHIMVDLLLLE